MIMRSLAERVEKLSMRPTDSEGVVVVKGVGGAERLSKWYRPSGNAWQCNEVQ